MKKRKLAAMLLTMTLSLGAFQAAVADEPSINCLSIETAACSGEPKGELNLLCASLKAAKFVNEGDRHKLLHKFEEVVLKLQFHKPEDAIAKLGQDPLLVLGSKGIRKKVDDLVQGGGRGKKTKILEAHGIEIIKLVDASTACITTNSTAFF